MAIVISVALMFGGLGDWVGAGWTLASGIDEKQSATLNSKWVPRRRPVLRPILIMLSTHLTGVMLFFAITSQSFIAYQTVSSQSRCLKTLPRTDPRNVLVILDIALCLSSDFSAGLLIDIRSGVDFWRRTAPYAAQVAQLMFSVHRDLCHIRAKLLPRSHARPRSGHPTVSPITIALVLRASHHIHRVSRPCVRMAARRTE